MRASSVIGRRHPVVVVLATAVAVASAACSSGGNTGKKILLERSGDAGPNAFTTSVHTQAAPSSTTPVSTPTTTAAGGVKRVSGVAPGLYGGTRNTATCDVEQMVAFLTSG